MTQALIFVSSYTKFANLAHVPSGTEAKHSIYTYAIDPEDGALTLIAVLPGVPNPAFMRYHPKKNILYACTESITENGEVHAFTCNPETGQLTPYSKEDAGGTSTCYLMMDPNAAHMLVINYWDSSISSLPLTSDGKLKPISHVARSSTRVATSAQEHVKNRQSEPHAHGLAFDPKCGKVIYVADLGSDCIRQYLYDSKTGKLVPAGSIPAGPRETGPHGPRGLLFSFRPARALLGDKHFAFVINELGSSVSVFAFDEKAWEGLTSGHLTEAPTLVLVQNISTVPVGFPKNLSTCARIALHPSGKWLAVSNRGHDSVAIFNVLSNGTLSSPTWFHTHGKTPRHFQFDDTGDFLIVANQDTDSIAVFSFNQRVGRLKFLSQYSVPSPNFICLGIHVDALPERTDKILSKL